MKTLAVGMKEAGSIQSLKRERYTRELSPYRERPSSNIDKEKS